TTATSPPSPHPANPTARLAGSRPSDPLWTLVGADYDSSTILFGAQPYTVPASYLAEKKEGDEVFTRGWGSLGVFFLSSSTSSSLLKSFKRVLSLDG
ncbi:hypothetical protein V493_07607, partial [Pseudogymnoascus sp. VKM F-4281 (FW-2241)]